ncbi:hypothetical protein BCR37DRAFT_389880 [Protomyces lactucae-debilis]|uniref:DUF1754-domain-containing protein n=1 Tax=Protomyces lactucae-debilis TaxID=2754530 RepID=A0A1Y2ESV1_PROLT|nr:uncharacterized protein BCR37DRAFT_389880 [Protomyces lactucae-debilis]ORY74627.1 hypothetical protein BCR37DRAFT_389880 [Protomyces lactucae-debilis]
MDYTAKKGKLKLKGGIKKKTSKPKSTAVASAQAQTEADTAASASASASASDAQESLRKRDTRTPAQRKFDEIKRIREQREIERTGGQSHQERIQAMNTHLSRLSEHHDMPKIGPG